VGVGAKELEEGAEGWREGREGERLLKVGVHCKRDIMNSFAESSTSSMPRLECHECGPLCAHRRREESPFRVVLMMTVTVYYALGRGLYI